MNIKLLLDANLSWRLVGLLKSEFPEISHTIYNGFEVDAPDTSIWNFALKNGYNIITNDEDFYLLAMNKGFPPKIVLLKMGNQSTRYIADVLIKHKTEISDFIEHEEYGVLEIY
jgi:predicted nuclease of predicted toxin-antitoxin system